jgi:hypothetical protein
MRKIFLLSIFAALGFTACKKKHNDVSQLVTVSYPTIKITNGQFYSFRVGGGPLPSANTIKATAYDSFYRESLPVVVDATNLTNIAPGLYVATVSAKNKYGYIGYGYVYVAISDVSDSLNLSGLYFRNVGVPALDSARPVYIKKVARDLYTTSNLGGVDTGTQATSITGGVFAVTSDTTIDFGVQNTASFGTFMTAYNRLDLTPGDTTLQYSIQNNQNFSNALRTFTKQQ